MFVPSIPKDLKGAPLLRMAMALAGSTREERPLAGVLGDGCVMVVLRDRDGALELVRVVPGVPEPASVQTYLSEADVLAGTVFEMAGRLRSGEDALPATGFTAEAVADDLDLYGNMISLAEAPGEASDE